MRLRIIACCVGISVVTLFPQLPSLLWLLPLSVLVLVSLKYKPIQVFGALSFGLIWGLLYGSLCLQQKLPENMENVDLLVTGQVIGLPKTSSSATSVARQRFDFKVKTLLLPDDDATEAAVKQIRINWYQTETPVNPGEIWQLRVRLKRPHGLANPGAFDYESWLVRRGINATGYVRKDAANQRLESAGVRAPVDRARFFLYQRLQSLSDYRYPGILLALLMGERSGVSSDLWQTFSATGTNHLFVISGLHVGFVALCSYFLVRQLSRIVVIGAPVIAAQQVAALFAILVSACYCALAGFALPTQRALIMLVVMMSAKVLKRQVHVGDSFIIALLFVLLWDPLAPRSLGFWLSFGAVGTLIAGFSGRTAQRSIWWRWGRPQWVIFVSFIPFLLFFFSQFSVISPLANSIAIPAVGLAVVPLCLLGGLLLAVLGDSAQWFFYGADFCLGVLVPLLQWMAGWPLAVVQLNPSGTALVLAGFGVLLVLAPAGLPARWLAILLFLPLLVDNRGTLSDGAYKITVFDVGQGTSVLLETRNHRLLYDVGPGFSDSFNSAGMVLLPFFQRSLIRYVDRIVVSHSDNDHAGSLSYLISAVEFGDVISGSELPEFDKTKLVACQSGQSWQWDGVMFQLMQAERSAWTNENNRSCVLKVDNTHVSLLLTGDIESEAERSLVRQFGSQLASNIMLAPHHGSRTSSGQAFLQAVSPQLALFTVGYLNRFGHPKADVLDRYHRLGIETMDTIRSGAITIGVEFDDSSITIEQYRDQRTGYWFNRSGD